VVVALPPHILSESEFNSEEYENWSTFAEANARIKVAYFALASSLTALLASL